jgi:MFS transporter, DHA2 family, multidrug resistance protein
MKSFSSAEALAERYPQYASAITAGARSSFDGADWAYLAGIVAVVVGGAIVFFVFPKKEDERRLLPEYHAADTVPAR